MGIIDTIRGKIDDADKAYNPFRKVADKMEEATKKVPGSFPGSDPQAQYEAKEKAMNAKNPFYKVDDSIKQVK